MSTVTITGSNINISVDGQVVYGQGNSAGGVAPPQNTPVEPITSMPNPSWDLPDNGQVIDVMATPGQVIGFRMTTRAGVYHRQLDWAGKPGGFFNQSSWAVFDSGGMRVMGGDNVHCGDGGMKIESPTLMMLGNGPYTLAISVNGSGNMGVRFNQQ